MPEPGYNEPVLEVFEAIREARRILEGNFPPLWIEGEVSAMKKHRSGHWYFVLKDDKAALNCTMFAHENRRVRFDVADGMKVRVKARLTIYEQRGQFQAKISAIELAGKGELEAARKILVDKLRGEGLLDAERKMLPRYPDRIAVVTSPQGDAPNDVQVTLAARWPVASVILVPTSVQGATAHLEVVSALARVKELDPKPDVVIVTRGGGSLEDLWTFNHESVARAIVDCPVPVVTGIGHEQDRTVADLVADVEALTPTDAAVKCTRDQRELYMTLHGHATRLKVSARRTLDSSRMRFRQSGARVRSPARHIKKHCARIDQLSRRLVRESARKIAAGSTATGQLGNRLSIRMETTLQLASSRITTTAPRVVHPRSRLAKLESELSEHRSRFFELARHRMEASMVNHADLSRRLKATNPRHRLRAMETQLDGHGKRLLRTAFARVQDARAELDASLRTLTAVSALATLDRGYAIAAIPDGSRWGTPVTDIARVSAGDSLHVHIKGGTIDTQVKKVRKQDDG